MSRQRVWCSEPQSLSSYKDGPGLDARTQDFLRSYPRAQGARDGNGVYPITCSNYLVRDQRYHAEGQLAPVDNKIAAFTRLAGGPIDTQLWVTTYPYFALNRTSLFGQQEDLLFHVHVPAPKVEEPDLGIFTSIFPFPGSRPRENQQDASPWRTPLTRQQFALAPVPDYMDDDNNNGQPRRFVNDGPILRPSTDILYLDKTFWRQYFERLDRNIDVLVPGVFPADLGQIRKAAVDIAVLRNRDEFTAVAGAIGRHLAGVQTLWAMVSRVVERPDSASPHQMAHIDYGIARLTDDQKVRLGIHHGDNYVPSRGVVTENLSRLGIAGKPVRPMQVHYMLLTYFDDALQVLPGQPPDVDIGLDDSEVRSSLSLFQGHCTKRISPRAESDLFVCRRTISPNTLRPRGRPRGRPRRRS